MFSHTGSKPLSFEYLEPTARDLILATLDYLKYSQPESGSDDKLNQTLEVLAGWKMPATSILALLACHSKKHGRPLEGPLALLNEEIWQMAREFETLDRSPVKQLDPGPLRKIYWSDRLRLFFFKAYTNLELVLLCLAAHIANMQAIGSLNDRQARLLAEDNEAIFLPLSEMLGMWQLRRELGDLSLKTLNPEKLWSKIQQQQEAIIDEQRRDYKQISEILRRLLAGAGIKAEISFHHSPPSSIYRRMLRGSAPEELLRKVKIDVVVATNLECYQVLGLVHQQYPPLAGRTLMGSYFRDLIAIPKFNGYRALITTVGYHGPDEEKIETPVPIEFRIYTYDMDRTNGSGIVAAKFLSTPVTIKNAWWEHKDMLDFIRAHPEGSKDEIYVFSPTGEVYKLPVGSTPIDYAYRVHSEVGNHCKRIWVNGHLETYDKKLDSGGLVEVETDPTYPGPKEKWLSVVKTSTAKTGIKRAQAHRQATPHRGREIIQDVLEAELRAYGLRDIPPDVVDKFLERTARHFKYSDVMVMYIDIANPNRSQGPHAVSPHKIVARLIATQLAGHIVKADDTALGIPEERIRFAQCYHNDKPCRVTPGAPIVGRLMRAETLHKYLMVYRQDCPNAPRQEEAIMLGWRGDRRPGEAVEVIIEAVDRDRLLGDVLSGIYALYDQGLYLKQLQATVAQDLSAHIEMKLTSQTHELLLLLQDKLGQLQDAGIISQAMINPLSPVEKILLARRNTLPNPYTVQPVRDSRLFKGRETEMEKIMTGLRGDQNLWVVYGVSRVGKTSLLRYMYDHILKYESRPLLVDMQGLVKQSETAFWQTIISKLIGEARAHFEDRGGKSRLQAAFKKIQDSSFGIFQEGLEKVKDLLQSKKLLILIDEFSVLDTSWSREEASRVIYQLKFLVENQPDLALILCVDETLYKTAFANDAASWPLLRAGTPLRLSYLDRHAAARLIREPMGQTVEYKDEAIEEILYLTAGHPSYLQLMLYETIVHISNRQRRQVTLEDIHLVSSRMLDTGNIIFRDFLKHDQEVRGIVLPILAHISEPVSHRATVDEVYALLQKRQPDVERFKVLQALEELRNVGVIEHHEESGMVTYYIPIPLFGRWLQKNRPLVLN